MDNVTHPEDAPRPAAVLWDMDGTLVDTEPYWIREEHRLVEEYGGSWSTELAKQCVGNSLLVSARVIKEHSYVPLSPPQIVDRLLDGVCASMSEHVPWRPGARELLAGCVAAGIPNALVTMSYTVLAQVLTDALPAGSFTAAITGDQVEHGKPHPEPYLRAAQAVRAAPGDCLAIEDSVPGVHSAHDAGVPTLAVPHVVVLPQLNGMVQVPSLAGIDVTDLPGILQRARAHRVDVAG